jgi:ADP-ribose pyrophosphatase YjhB (NUDIX family)
MRELLEETGVTAANPELLTVIDAIDRDEAGHVRFHYTLIAILATWRSGEATPADDALATLWARPEDLVDMPVSAAVENVMLLALDRPPVPRSPT